MDAPGRHVVPGGAQRVLPRDDVVVDGVDERAVEVEEDRCGGHATFVPDGAPPPVVRGSRSTGGHVAGRHVTREVAVTGQDVVVVGAGVVGLAAARGLALAGARVRVVEREVPGAGATRVAAGILTPTDVHEWAGALGALHHRALLAWPGYAAELAEAAGRPVGWRACGSLRVDPSGDAQDGAWLAATGAAADALGLPAERLDGAACADRVPGLVPVAGGLWLPDDGAVDTEQLVVAQTAAAGRAGVTFEHDEVVALRRSGGRVTGVRLAAAGDLAADAVVVAVGAEAARASWLPPDDRPAIEPVAGEAVLAGPPGGADTAPPVTSTVVRTRLGSVAPRDGGRSWLGTSVRRDGFVRRPRIGEVAALLRRAIALLPRIAELDVLDVRVGLRPVPLDGRPHVGPGATPGLFHATGHGREGILHAPLVAVALPEAVASGALPDWADTTRPRTGRPPASGRRAGGPSARGPR
ncbi:FAD-dependent oxidoreductase [Nitriliruptoraceae bacterium ZYF776]|nr:FAD-dependent oxidoreductase [Profundirhabdus halotolerans]